MDYFKLPKEKGRGILIIYATGAKDENIATFRVRRINVLERDSGWTQIEL